MPSPPEVLSLRRFVEEEFTPDCVERVPDEISSDAAADVTIDVSHVTLDFAMRGWMKDGPGYLATPSLGDPVRGFATGRVAASNDPSLEVGMAVTGFLGVRNRVGVSGEALAIVDETVAPLSRWAGNLGLSSAVTGYLGLTRLGRPAEGETVLVSGASGSVGSAVGQIARNLGCRVVGVAGGPEKRAMVMDRYGFDACVDYRSPNLLEEIQRSCPEGVNVYFDNAGGLTLDAALASMAPFGRVVLCGFTADRAGGAPYRLANFRSMISKRVTMSGFILFDHEQGYQEAVDAIAGWYADGELVVGDEDIREGGLAAFSDGLGDLLAGRNAGKLVLAL